MKPVRMVKVKTLVDKDHQEKVIDILSRDHSFHLSGFINEINGWENLIPLHIRPERFNSTYIEGWVPANDIEKVVEKIKKLTDRKCILEIEEAEHEDAPVILRNSWILRPFERIVRSFGIPAYDELDPTPIMALFFPLIFGIMFADIGHGILLAITGIAALIADKKGIKGGEMMNYVIENGSLFLLCGIASIISGIIFEEFFGYHVKTLPLKITIPEPIGIKFPFSPIEQPMTMLKLSLLVASIHLSSGLMINLINKLMNREYLEAFIEPGCWLWFYVGFIISIFINKLDIMAWIKNPLTLFGILLPLMLMFFGKIATGDPTEGFSLTFEAAISSLSNTVSYGRLLALSLAHSLMSSMFVSMSGGNVLILAIGTIATMLLEGLVIFIHTTRLMWVEWFSKFYKGTGEEFQPLQNF